MQKKTAVMAPAYSSAVAQSLGTLKINGKQPRDAFLGHCYAIQAIHASHGQPVMGDDEKPRALPGQILEQTAEAVDVRVIEGSIDLVQHADRRRPRQENGKAQCDGGERLLATR